MAMVAFADLVYAFTAMYFTMINRRRAKGLEGHKVQDTSD